MQRLLFKVRTGKIMGRDHIHSRRNCQDGCTVKFIAIDGQEFLVGVVSDGCGSGKASEVAGILLPQFVVNQIEHLLRFETPILQIPVSLYPYVVAYLDGIRKQIPFSSPADVVQFINDHLLATAIGFVIGQDEGIVFHAGDGFLVVNDEIIKIEHGNKSPYPAYHLVPRSALKGEVVLPRTFDVRVVNPAKLKRLVVATDGFRGGMLERMLKETFQKPFLGETGVQRWMNWINGSRNPDPDAGLFFDDAAIVSLEKID
ncbi:MAG: protein phosphatase 2C domain-containing protein [Candidatus Cloacimonetes bacterium]|nr:protein phosphatase 2C domain-containing protein [Candidatus Cloacimonadota bacterium]